MFQPGEANSDPLDQTCHLLPSLNWPGGRVVIDDGRRFLQRDRETYDVITLDPPPPVEASGSALLYSTEFYVLATSHLTTRGLLQQWFPGGETKIYDAVYGALARSFAHVRVYRSVEGWDFHFLAADHPGAISSPGQAIARMPSAARTDLLEWFPGQSLVSVIGRLLNSEVSTADQNRRPGELDISDDRPINEYYLLRRNCPKVLFGSVLLQ
jgi:spermidine synthase